MLTPVFIFTATTITFGAILHRIFTRGGEEYINLHGDNADAKKRIKESNKNYKKIFNL